MWDKRSQAGKVPFPFLQKILEEEKAGNELPPSVFNPEVGKTEKPLEKFLIPRKKNCF